jgi:excisionase family DNA binding protein
MAIEPSALTARGPEGATVGVDERWHLLSVREVATACRLSEKAVRRAIDAGELPAVKLRSRLRVTPQDFEAWIAAGRGNRGRVPFVQRPRAPRRAPAGMFRGMVEHSDNRGLEP